MARPARHLGPSGHTPALELVEGDRRRDRPLGADPPGVRLGAARRSLGAGRRPRRHASRTLARRRGERAPSPVPGLRHARQRRERVAQRAGPPAHHLVAAPLGAAGRRRHPSPRLGLAGQGGGRAEPRHPPASPQDERVRGGSARCPHPARQPGDLRPFVELHPDEAAARGLVAGSEVTVSSANGGDAAVSASEAPLKAPDQKMRVPLRTSTDTPRGAAAVLFDQPGMAANVLLDSSGPAAYVTVAP
ncbi:MAG: hypothetical protein E6G66_01415 [Actinobacteria bacterium]|nr:MAG: hypothetical protein E6G66_01415 [Actinomycetota bacterium]